MAETHVIEIRAGHAEPTSLELRPGVELAPLSVGTGGAWQVSTSGVKTVHAYLYFDGQTLFLQSADDKSPATMNGRAVPGSWTAAAAPCTITLAQAQLVFRSTSASTSNDDEERTVAEMLPDPRTKAVPVRPEPVAAKPTPAAPAKVARPFRPGAFANAPDDESTRFAPVGVEDLSGDSGSGPVSGDSTRVEPIHAIAAAAGVPLNVRPAAGMPLNRGGGTMQSPAVPMRGPAYTEPERTPFVSQSSAPQYGGGFPPPPPQGLPPTVALNPPAPAYSNAPAPAPYNPPGPAYNQPGPTAYNPPGPSGAPQPPPGLLNVPPPSVRQPVVTTESFPDKIKREWAAAPPLRKGLIAVFPLAFLGFLYVMFGGEPPPPPRPPITQAQQPSATTNVAVTPPPLPPVLPPVLPPIPPYQPPGTDTQPVGPGPGQVPPRGTASAAASSSGSQIGPDAGQANSDHRERQAADFVATHNYDLAIRIYDQLATERPQNPAFHEAARILRQKLDSGT